MSKYYIQASKNNGKDQYTNITFIMNQNISKGFPNKKQLNNFFDLLFDYLKKEDDHVWRVGLYIGNDITKTHYRVIDNNNIIIK